jgi:hypothetical protein
MLDAAAEGRLWWRVVGFVARRSHEGQGAAGGECCCRWGKALWEVDAVRCGGGGGLDRCDSGMDESSSGVQSRPVQSRDVV